MLNEKSVHFFSLLLETLERSGTGAERAKNLVSGSGAVSGCEKVGWSGSGAGAGGRGAGNGAVSGSVRNRFERRAEILPLPLRSHALELMKDLLMFEYSVVDTKCPYIHQFYH